MATEKTPPSLKDLLDSFDAAEADYQGIARASGVVSEVEVALGKFLETVWPKIQPFVMEGVDFLAIAAGGITGPLGPLVAYVLEAFGKVGLNYLVQFLGAKLAAKPA